MMNMKETSGGLPHEMENSSLNTVLDIIEAAGRLTSSTVIVAGGDRADDLQLVESARDHGFVDRIVLVGNGDLIKRTVADLGIEIPEKDIIHAEGAEEIAARTVQAALEQDIDILLKGGVTTSVLSRHMLKLANRPTASLVTMLDAATFSDGRLLFLSDAGLTTVCNFGRLSGILRNAVDVARAVTGMEKPRVAVLSAYEGVIPSLPSTRFGRELAGLDWPDARVCGPLSFDLATDPKAMEIKGIPDLPNADEVVGRADVLICPNIETGNVLYKSISAQARFGQASLANIAVGFDVSYGIISRADSVETRLASIALCGVYAQRSRSLRKRPALISRSGDSVSRAVLFVHCEPSRVRAEIYRGGRRLLESHVDWNPVSALEAGRIEEEIESCVRDLETLVRKGGFASVDAVGCAGGLSDSDPGRPPESAVRLAGPRKGRIIRSPRIEAVNLAAAGRAGWVPLGVPLAGRLAERLQAPAFLIDPVQPFRSSKKSPGRGPDLCSEISAWLAPAVVSRAEGQFGLPPASLRLTLALSRPRPAVVVVKNGAIEECRIFPGPIEDTENGQGAEEDWLLEQIAVIFQNHGDCIHALVPVEGGTRFPDLLKRIKSRFTLNAPVLPFDGGPDSQRIARRLAAICESGTESADSSLTEE